jgi:spore maturation protein SpmA
MTTFIGAGVLGAIFAAAFLQDLSYTSKTVLVSHGRRTLAVAADIIAMLASSFYLILTASVTIRSGLSVATAEAFLAIAVGGACGTVGGMTAADWLERLFALGPPRLTRSRHLEHDDSAEAQLAPQGRFIGGGLSSHAALSARSTSN